MISKDSNTIMKMLVALLCVCGVSGLSSQILKSFPLEHAATVTSRSQVASSLLVTTFGAFGADASYLLANLSLSTFDKANLRVIDTSVDWPNEAQDIPQPAIANWFGSGNWITVAGGFFANPAKATGRVTAINLDSGTEIQLSTDKKGYFYHHVEWLPLGTNTSQLFAVAARVHVPDVGTSHGELVYFAKEGDTWQTHVLFQGPDVHFMAANLGEKTFCFVATEYFTAKAMKAYCCPKDNWLACSAEDVQTYVVDDQEDAGFFDCHFADVNGDGKRDILAITNAANGHGAVIVYEQIAAPSGGAAAWSKHVLQSGYIPTLPYLPGRGAPGAVTPFLVPSSACKQSLLLSGDDGAFVSMIQFASCDATDWTTTQTFIYNSTGTIGSPAIVSIADSSVQVIVPDYSKNQMLWLNVSL